MHLSVHTLPCSYLCNCPFTPTSVHTSQDEAAANLIQHNAMQDQRIMFEKQLAESAQLASDQRTSFEGRLAELACSLAQAARQNDDMKASYEQGALLASDDAEQKRKTSVGVSEAAGRLGMHASYLFLRPRMGMHPMYIIYSFTGILQIMTQPLATFHLPDVSFIRLTSY